MLYGIVDIGSNTIRLKIYEYKNNKIKSVFSKKKTAGLIAYRDDGKLNDEGINILSSILNKFKLSKNSKILDISLVYFSIIIKTSFLQKKKRLAQNLLNKPVLALFFN